MIVLMAVLATQAADMPIQVKTPTDRPAGRPPGDGGYLFVTFKGEQTPMTEQIHFALSQDGRHWKALNDAQPVLVSPVGEKGVPPHFL